MTDDSAVQNNEMISYAQNYEDVILQRIFANESTGFYVDIGACHPIHDSVTQHFYLRGWHGINVEPQPELFGVFQRLRERDTNLNICVGCKPGKQTLYVTADQGTSTLDSTLARHYQDTGRVTQEIDVEVVPLADIWKQHVGSRRVDFLKIDVEGFEKDVLASADFAVVNPRILLVESVHPDSHEPVHQEWESLISAYYCLFYFDGLNRFYYRKDYPVDIPRCSTPPNVFDEFKTYREYLVEQACHHLEDEVEDKNTQIRNFGQLLEQKDAALQKAADAYNDLRSQIDWYLSEQGEGYKAQIGNFEQLLKQKDAALQDAADAYKELRARFDEQLDEIELLTRSKD
ncbi:FkbM family methyltransferase [Pseudomonas sp. C2B4]|uniref:FkbM family methyltransferase n=1 Tax=Pseudomonas sp. C2B4 TaxID=2735270 RepID=UPI0015868E95|nr:FkbM family methyltransferase [Pseudomonas sp. C2B4]NUU35666.1 FkbM family methyltransferase [Pseudomonas sp. C2B4]